MDNFKDTHSYTNAEIERKWLLSNGIPSNLEGLRARGSILQGYLDTLPEVRITKISYENGEPFYNLTYKTFGDLVRTETECSIPATIFTALRTIINKPLIHKDYYEYCLDNDLIAQCAVVDGDIDCTFTYLEIEFPTEAEASAFQPLEWFGEEITYNRDYKMANYWNRTRLQR